MIRCTEDDTGMCSCLSEWSVLRVSFENNIMLKKWIEDVLAPILFCLGSKASAREVLVEDKEPLIVSPRNIDMRFSHHISRLEHLVKVLIGMKRCPAIQKTDTPSEIQNKRISVSLSAIREIYHGGNGIRSHTA